MRSVRALIGILATSIATSALGQGGYVTFKTSLGKNPVFYSTSDLSNLQLVPTNGVTPFGTINYEFLTAPNGTAPLTAAQILSYATSGSLPSGWTATPIGPFTYGFPGVITPITVTLPASSGPAGANVEMTIFAYTGSFQAMTSLAYTGEDLGVSSFTYNDNGISYTTGALSWSQPTGNLKATPPGPPSPLVTGSAGFGALVFMVPEPSSIALGVLGAASLLLFRRRK